MSLMRLVTSEVKLMLRSRARTTMLLVATRVCAWAAPAATASASGAASNSLFIDESLTGRGTGRPVRLLDEDRFGQFQVAGGKLRVFLAQTR